MKTVAVFLLLAVAPVFGQGTNSESPDQTGGIYNGRYWVRCPQAVKAGFVVGFNSAMQMGIAVSAQDRDKFAFKGTVGDLVMALDNYYRREDDLQMPIWVAIRILKLERDGLSQSEIGERLVADGVWHAVVPAK